MTGRKGPGMARTRSLCLWLCSRYAARGFSASPPTRDRSSRRRLATTRSSAGRPSRSIRAKASPSVTMRAPRTQPTKKNGMAMPTAKARSFAMREPSGGTPGEAGEAGGPGLTNGVSIPNTLPRPICRALRRGRADPAARWGCPMRSCCRRHGVRVSVRPAPSAVSRAPREDADGPARKAAAGGLPRSRGSCAARRAAAPPPQAGLAAAALRAAARR